MSLQGPVVVIAEEDASELTDALTAAGATPFACIWAQAAAAIRASRPVGVIVNTDSVPPDDILDAVLDELDDQIEPFLPVLARASAAGAPVIEDALPISPRTTVQGIVARLASALRVRTLEIIVAERAAAFQAGGGEVPPLPDSDPLEDAAVLVTGRGRSYPELCTAVGERVGLIGALSVETAARYLTKRPLDGVIIGEGFGPAIVNALLTALGEDRRFRGLPIALIGGMPVGVDCSTMPNFERFDAPPAAIVDWMLPLIRLHAYEARVQRQLAAIEAGGMLDPVTGLYTADAFARAYADAVGDARGGRRPLSLARLTLLPGVDRRILLDAARQTAGLMRSVDFAMLAEDGAILLALTQTDLRHAHVIARRVASTLKATVLTSDRAEDRVDPTVSLATLTAADSAETLMARVSGREAMAMVAAE